MCGRALRRRRCKRVSVLERRGGGGGQEVTDDVGRAVIVTVKTATKPSIAGYFDVSTL